MKLFNLRAQIILPFDHFKNLGCVSRRIGTNKAWELQHTYYAGCLFDIDCELSYQEDHAGFEICLGIFGYGVSFHIYDTRHWNNELNCWEQHETSYTNF